MTRVKPNHPGEEGLNQAAATWGAIIDSFTDSVMVLDEAGKVLQANRAAGDLLGIAPGRIPGKSCAQLMLSAGFPAQCCPPAPKEKRRQAQEYDIHLPERNRWLRVSVHPVRSGRGGTGKTAHVMRDVSDWYRMKQELEYSNTLMRTQQESALDGILVVSAAGKILSYNQQFVDIWQLPEDILESRLNERALEYVSALVVNFEAANAVVRDLYENRHRKSHDEVLLRDGRVVDRYSAPLEAEDGRFYGRVWYFRDITAQKKAGERIRQANDRLRATVNQLKEQKKQSAILSEMREMLQACSSTSEVGSIVQKSMLNLFSHASGALYMLADPDQGLQSIAAWGLDPRSPDAGGFLPDECWALRRGRTHLVEDPAVGPLCTHLGQESAVPLACLPLVAKGEVLGVLNLRGSTEAPPELQRKTAEHIGRLATTICEYLSLSIANLRLREQLAEQSIRDPLTGLYNRRYLEESLQREIGRAERSRTPVSIVMMDIDYFKSFNDRYGHPAGDALLAALGAFLKRNLRAGDVACRYGGEEFILFLPDASLEGACRNMERILKGVENLEIAHMGVSLPAVTLSMGIAAYPDHGGDMETLIHAADAALYRAKEQGRNRLVAAAI